MAEEFGRHTPTPAISGFASPTSTHSFAIILISLEIMFEE